MEMVHKGGFVENGGLKRFIFPYTPQTHVRVTQGDKTGFRIPELCPHGCGLPRRNINSPLIKVEKIKKEAKDLWNALGGSKWKPKKGLVEVRYGCPHMISEEGLRRKNRILKYNEYKETISGFAKSKQFVFPFSGAAVYFFIPMPLRWTVKKRREMNLELHEQKPDLDNLTKALGDSLFKEDEAIGHYAGLGKYWVDTTYKARNSEGKTVIKKRTGWIEVHLDLPVYNPKQLKNDMLL